MKPNAFTQKLFDERASVYDEWVSGFWTGFRRRIDEEVKKHLSQVSPPIRLLDIGCGTGSRLKNLLTDFPRENFSLLAAGDLSRGMVVEAQKNLENYPVGLFQGSIAALPFGDEQFDVVLALYAVLGCLPDSKARLQAFCECHRILKPGGVLLLDVLNRNHPFYLQNPSYFDAARRFKKEHGWAWSKGDLLVEKEPGRISLNHGFERKELNELCFPLFLRGDWVCFDPETGEDVDESNGHFFGVLKKESLK